MAGRILGLNAGEVVGRRCGRVQSGSGASSLAVQEMNGVVLVFSCCSGMRCESSFRR